MRAEATAEDVIRRWLELSEVERRAFGALARELNASSDLVESSTADLSERFQAPAIIAQAQTGRVAKIIEVSETITVAGEAVPISAAMQSVEGCDRDRRSFRGCASLSPCAPPAKSWRPRKPASQAESALAKDLVSYKRIKKLVSLKASFIVMPQRRRMGERSATHQRC